MTAPASRSFVLLRVVVAVGSLSGAGFLILFGLANLVHHDVPKAYYAQNTVVSLVVSALGVAALFVAAFAIRRLLRRGA